MSRDFSKNASNFMVIGTAIGALNPRLNGSASVAVSAWFYADSFNTAANDNRIITIFIGSAAGLTLCCHDGTNAKLRANWRSQNGDTIQTKAGTTTLSTGQWYHVLAVCDFANDTGELYLNGVSESATGSISFTPTSWTAGTNFAGSFDSIGSTIVSSVPSSTATQFDGRIAEVAVYGGSTALGLAEAVALASGISPLDVRPAMLKDYWRLIGDASPERDVIGRQEGVITGTVAAIDHPLICDTDSDWQNFVVSAGGGTFTITPTAIPNNHAGNITLTITGSGESFVQGVTVFDVSGAGLTKVSQNITGNNAATVVVTSSASTGTGTVTQTVTGSSSNTTTVGVPSISIAADTGYTGTTPTITVTGTNTVLDQENPTGLFTVAGGSGASISSINVTSPTAATFTLTVGTAGGTLTIEEEADSVTDTFTATLKVYVNNSMLNFSPLNWRLNGSTSAITIDAGSYVDISWSGSANLTALTAFNSFTGTVLRPRCIVDGVEKYATAVANSATSLALATGLSGGTHFGRLWYDGYDHTQNLWDLTQAFILLGFTLDAGATLIQVTPRTRTIIVTGDSNAVGFYATAASNPTGHRATYAWWVAVAEAINAEVGNISFNGQGFGGAGLVDVPQFWNATAADSAIQWYSDGESRLVAGAYPVDPDYWFDCHGNSDVNRYPSPTSGADITTGATGAYGAARTYAPTTRFISLGVFTAHSAVNAAILDGFDAAYGAHTTLVTTKSGAIVYRGGTDIKAYRAILPSQFTQYFNTTPTATYGSLDGTHPNSVQAAVLGAIVVEIIEAIEIAEASGSGGASPANLLGGILQ